MKTQVMPTDDQTKNLQAQPQDEPQNTNQSQANNDSSNTSTKVESKSQQPPIKQENSTEDIKTEKIPESNQNNDNQEKKEDSNKVEDENSEKKEFNPSIEQNQAKDDEQGTPNASDKHSSDNKVDTGKLNENTADKQSTADENDSEIDH